MRGQRIRQSTAKAGANSQSMPPIVPLCIRKTEPPLIQSTRTSKLQPRIMIYAENVRHSHRFHHNSAIAQALAHSHLHADVLLISDQDAPQQLDSHIQWVTVSSENLSANTERVQQVHQMLMSFAPDILIVENNCSGTSPDLASLLQNARALHNTRCVLALDSDVNPPQASTTLYNTLGQGIHSYYDQIWIYGDAQVEDAIHAISFAPLIRKKIRYTGYITPRQNKQATTSKKKRTKTLLVFGQGETLAQSTDLIINTILATPGGLTILTSPHMPINAVKSLVALSKTQKALLIETDPTQLFSLLEKHDRVITLDDEETALSALAQNKPLLVIHDEQTNRQSVTNQRFQQLQNLKLTNVLLSNELNAQMLQAWLDAPPSITTSTPLDCDGLKNLPQLVGTLLTTDRRKSSR